MDFRYAEIKDRAFILQCIEEFGRYDRMLQAVSWNEDQLEWFLFDEEKAEVLFVMEADEDVGFALFFCNPPGNIYLEDLYVKPEYRKKGYEKSLLKQLCLIAVERVVAAKSGDSSLSWWRFQGPHPVLDFADLWEQNQ